MKTFFSYSLFGFWVIFNTLFSGILLPQYTDAYVDPKIGGVISSVLPAVKNRWKDGEGVLFVYARIPGKNFGPPVAAFRFPKPRLPQAFVLTAKNLIMKDQPFQGPYEISALYVPSGDPMDKTGGLRGQDGQKKIVNLGEKSLNIVFDTAL